MPVYTASCLLPVAGPPIVGGGLWVEDGRIAAVGRLDAVLEAAGGGEVCDLGDAVVLPGLVNAHTHLELSWLGESPPPGDDYVGWVRGVLERRVEEDEVHARTAAEGEIERLVARGTVAVGDVGNRGWTAPLLARAGLEAVVFLELIEPRPDRARGALEQAVATLDALAEDADVRGAGDRLTIVPAPHGPHTTGALLLRGLFGAATAAGRPLSIHAAESAAECELLRDGGGPLAELMRERGLWDEGFKPPGDTPIAYLDRLRVLSPLTVLVHAVQNGPRDRKIIQSRGACVVTCPRSNERLGVGVAPVHALLMDGVPVALGTDSLASAPSLDLFEEMAALRAREPALKPPLIVRMATLNGARALGRADRLGSLEVGKLARAIVVPLPDPDADPYEVLCSVPPEVYPLESAPWQPRA